MQNMPQGQRKSQGSSKTLKLWEAILIGSDRRAQGFKEMFVTQPNGEIYSCAFGAAEEAISGVPKSSRVDFLKHYPFLKVCHSCPKCGGNAALVDTILHLNDFHRWPREKIALEFVRPIEEGQANDNSRLGR